MGERSPNGFRKCKRCGEIKLKECFSTERPVCDLCKLPTQEKIYANEQERKKAERKRYYEKHPDKKKEERRRAREKRNIKWVSDKEGYNICRTCGMELPYSYFSNGAKGRKCKKCSGQKFYTLEEYKQSLKRTCKRCGMELPLNMFSKTGKTCVECKKKPLQEYIITPDSERKRCEDYRRKARKSGLVATFTYKQWLACKTAFNNRCAYCGEEKDLTQDHFIPSTNGGGYSKDNIIPVCHICNSSKSDSDFFEWYPQQTFYSKQREQKLLKYLNYKGNYQQLAI